MQIVLAEALAKRVDSATTWWSSIDGSWAPSPWIGQLRRQRGCKSGVADLLVLHDGRLIAIELKTARGRLTAAQKGQRVEVLSAGGAWYLCRSVAAVLEALRREGVPLKRAMPDPHAFNPGLLDHQPQPDPAVRRKRCGPAPRGLACFRARARRTRPPAGL